MRINPRLHLTVGIALPVLGLAIFCYSLEVYGEAGRHLTPASVSVSGYHRRDGTYVRPYHRRPPGGVAHDAPYERTRSLCQGGMLLGVAVSLVPLLPFLIQKKWKQSANSGVAVESARQEAEQRERAEEQRKREEERKRREDEGIHQERERQQRDAERAVERNRQAEEARKKAEEEVKQQKRLEDDADQAVERNRYAEEARKKAEEEAKQQERLQRDAERAVERKHQAEERVEPINPPPAPSGSVPKQPNGERVVAFTPIPASPVIIDVSPAPSAPVKPVRVATSLIPKKVTFEPCPSKCLNCGARLQSWGEWLDDYKCVYCRRSARRSYQLDPSPWQEKVIREWEDSGQ
jgi:hypothetical protein